MCGQPVLLVFHVWNGATNRATFEYHHIDDATKDEPTPCTVIMPYDEGITRYAAESADLSSTPH